MFIMLLFISTIFMKTTASTPTEILSFVITSCFDTSNVLILKSLDMASSKKGIIKNSPGPGVLVYFPNLSTIASSHCWFILTADQPMYAKKTATIHKNMFPDDQAKLPIIINGINATINEIAPLPVPLILSDVLAGSSNSTVSTMCSTIRSQQNDIFKSF